MYSTNFILVSCFSTFFLNTCLKSKKTKKYTYWVTEILFKSYQQNHVCDAALVSILSTIHSDPQNQSWHSLQKHTCQNILSQEF